MHSQFFTPLYLGNHKSTDQVTTSLRNPIAVSLSLLPAWGSGAAPPTEDIPRATASSALSAETIGRCPRRPGEEAGRRSSRWYVALGCSLALVRYPIFSSKMRHVSIPRQDPRTSCVSRNSVKNHSCLFVFGTPTGTSYLVNSSSIRQNRT